MSDTVSPGEADKLAGARNDGTALGGASDVDAAPAAELEQASLAKLPERAEDGVGIDAEYGGEVARRRQPLPWVRLAVGDRATEFGGDLLVELGRILPVQLDASHGASDTSSIIKSLLLIGDPKGVEPQRW